MQAPPGPRTVFDGRPVLWFGGTSYLGLHADPRVLRAAADAVHRYGVHTATSRAVWGDSPVVRDAEAACAALFGTASALHLPSGWLTPIALCRAALAEPQPTRAFVPETAHWCGRDALLATGCEVEVLPVGEGHELVGDLRQSLLSRRKPGERALVWCDGIGAADGRLAPLAAIATLLREHGEPGDVLAVDDAHGFGCLGAEGRGSLEHEGLWSTFTQAGDGPRLFVGGTASKAVGGYGGLVPLRQGETELIRRAAPVALGASAPSAADAAATAAALAIVKSEPERRERLARRVERFRSGLGALGIELTESPVPFVGLTAPMVGGPARPRQVSEHLEEKGLVVPWLPRYAGVPPGGVLRITITSEHEEADIDALLEGLAAVV